MTRLTKIPMIAAFSAVIAAFAVTTEASADRGDGRHYSRSDDHRGGGHYRGRDYNRSHDREYRGHRDYNRSYNREYHGHRDYGANRGYYGDRSHRSDHWRGDRHWSDNRHRGDHWRNDHWRNDRWRGRDNWHGDRRWSDHRYHGNHWRGDRRHYSGYHGRPHYDYRRSWRDRDYYWQHRHHWSSWRPYYGPIWSGYRHSYWNNRGCVPVTRYWTWDGRPALVGGIQCYNPHGAAYIVNDDYYPLNYY